MSGRASGILLHITSLPSRYGVGDLGPAAYRFVDFLADAGQSYWQVLPLNPTDIVCGNSPYSSISAFAGNTLLISPELLVHQGLLEEDDLANAPEFEEGRCDYARATSFKVRLLHKAYTNFRERKIDKAGFDSFCEEHAPWLDDYALFVSIKRKLGGGVWSEWPAELRDREPACMEAVARELAGDVQRERYLQYLLMRQYFHLRDYCTAKRVEIIGDIPIYVTYDSAEVWRHPELFKLGPHGRPEVVAGVPPDYFSKTGQLWGNPVYDWESLARTNFEWWMQRMAFNFHLFDLVRIDHFRGLVNFWEVPSGAVTAVGGHWACVPTEAFFAALQLRFGKLPIIAEDLGLITKEVREVIDGLGFPGMKVLLFAFNEDNPAHPYLPRNFVSNCVAYTGTHDNNTARGWFEIEALPADRKRLSDYVGREVTANTVHTELAKLAMDSVADTVIIPMQDLLGLGAACRMNHPATVNGNWVWRLRSSDITPEVIAYLAEMTRSSERAV